MIDILEDFRTLQQDAQESDVNIRHEEIDNSVTNAKLTDDEIISSITR